MQLQRVYHDTLDFIQVPDFPSAIRVFALTHSRRNVVQREPWLISVSLDEEVYSMNSKITPAQVSPGVL
jgi:hypothetical protein